MITRLTGPATRSSTSVIDHVAGELAVREVPVDPVADPALLDRDQRRRVVLQDGGDRRPGVEGLLVDHLERRVAEARPRRWRRRPRAGRRPRRAGRAGRRSGSCRAASGRWRARRGRRRRARGVRRRRPRARSPRASCRRRRPTSAGCRRCRARPAAAASRVTGRPAPGPRARRARAAAPSAPGPSRRPAGGSRGSRRWSRVIAQSVPLSVATGPTTCWPSTSKRARVSRRRVWKSVQFEVEVSSRYLPWVGIHASQSNLRCADRPRSPAAVSITR